MEITNRAKLYNDGKIESDDLELNPTPNCLTARMVSLMLTGLSI